MPDALLKWGLIALFAVVGLWIINQNILNMFPNFISWIIGGFLLVVAGYAGYKELK